MWRYQISREEKSEKRFSDDDFYDMLFEVSSRIRYTYKPNDSNTYEDVTLYHNGKVYCVIKGEDVSKKETEVRQEINQIDDKTYFNNLNKKIQELYDSDKLSDVIVGGIIYIWAM